MTMQADQLNPRRPVPFSDREFDWRREEIEQFAQHDVTYHLDDNIEVVIVWNGTPLSWPKFLEWFGSWCKERGEVPF